MSAAFPKVYRSYDEFEREELRKLDSLRTTINDMLEEQFSEELDFEQDGNKAGNRGRGRSKPD